MASLRKRLHTFLIENAYLNAEHINHSLEYYFEIPDDEEIPSVIVEIMSKRSELRHECSIRSYTLPGVPHSRCFTLKIYGGWLYGWGSTGRPIRDYLVKNGLA